MTIKEIDKHIGEPIHVRDFTGTIGEITIVGRERSIVHFIQPNHSKIYCRNAWFGGWWQCANPEDNVGNLHRKDLQFLL